MRRSTEYANPQLYGITTGRPQRVANRHQPKKKLLTIRRGEGGEEWRGGPLWSPASCSLCLHVGGTRSHPRHRATIKAHSTSTQPPSPLRIIRPPVSLPGFG